MRDLNANYDEYDDNEYDYNRQEERDVSSNYNESINDMLMDGMYDY